MEDSHAFVYDYGGVKGQGYFAVFDGHAGKHAAEWCGAHFHKYLLNQLQQGQDTQPIPDLLNATFHVVDGELSKLAAAGGTHSGCTAVTAFLRYEDENGNAVKLEKQTSSSNVGSQVEKGGVAANDNSDNIGAAPPQSEETELRTRDKIKSLFTRSSSSSPATSKEPATATSSTTSSSSSTSAAGTADNDDATNANVATGAVHDDERGRGRQPHHTDLPSIAQNLSKRTLYTANVGDARAVLCRGGKAVRLTYDHKGSDAQEAKRITDAGGFVMNNRVNGVLAVTRSLGDSSMKEFVVGSPYTTETTLGEDDKFLIIACDGLWDVCEDQMAVDLIRDLKDAQEASQVLLDHALQNFSTDNLSVLVVALKPAEYL